MINHIVYLTILEKRKHVNRESSVIQKCFLKILARIILFIYKFQSEHRVEILELLDI